jgi:lipopolysaccharide biosynthesis glycosyltransferase
VRAFVKQYLILLLLSTSFCFRLFAENVEVTITKHIENVKPAFPNDNVSIVFGCDDNYAMYLGVCLQSLIETSSAKHNYDIWILDGNISENNRRGIVKLINGRRNFSIRFFNVNDFVEKNIEKFRIYNKYLTLAAYYRLFIPQIFFNYGRMLYLDCDIIVNTDLSKLFYSNLNSKSIGAAQDYSMSWKSFRQYAERIKGKKSEEYFNSGVILFDIKKTAKENISNKCLEYLSSRKDEKGEFHEDQDALNAVCIDNVKLIDKRWNGMMHTYSSDINETNFDMNFHIIHYSNPRKPWFCSTPFDAIWWHYAAKTPFYKDILARNRNLIILQMIRIRIMHFSIVLLQWLHMDDLIWRLEKIQLSLIAKTVGAMTDMAAFKHLKIFP